MTALRYKVDPFKSPIKAKASSVSRTTSNTKIEQFDVLATADLLLEQLKELEGLYSTVEERVQRKRKALKELEYLILGSDSPRSPACPANTPIGSRLRLVSPRLRGLFDLRGPGQANFDAIQSCLDYSPETHIVESDFSTREDIGHSEEWVDDTEEALVSPFDDKYALWQSPKKVEKELPAIPREASDGLESKIPRKVHVRRQMSASRRLTGRPSGAVTRNTSSRRRHSVRTTKATRGASDLQTKGTMRRGSWKRSVMETAKAKGGAKVSSTIENESSDGRDNARRKGKKKGLWSIYSVCSEFGLSGTPRAV